MGREARARKKWKETHTNITGEKCADIASRARKALDEVGVTLDPDSDLEQMIRDVEWLSSFGPDPFATGCAPSVDVSRSVNAFLRLEQMSRLTMTLMRLPLVANYQRHLPWLSKRLDRIRKRTVAEANRSEAQDFLFELEIAGRLAVAPFDHKVSFEEPDIALRSGDTRIVIACKRPRSLETLGKALLRAATQIRDGGCSGCIVVGAEYLLHGYVQGRPASLFECETDSQALAEGEKRLRQAEQHVREELADVFDVDNLVGGIILCAPLVYLTPRPLMIGWHWARRRIANPNVPFVASMLSLLDRVIADDYPTRAEMKAYAKAADRALQSTGADVQSHARV